MKKLVAVICLSLLIISCKSDKSSDKIAAKEIAMQEVNYAPFGAEINAEGALSSLEIIEKYKTLKAGDTAIVKFEAKVNEVCQAKGCWMRLDLGDDETMVKFKDYGFFMPKNIAGKEVVVNGKAFVAEVSVEEQRHYAEDAGRSKEEIEAITEVQKTLSFEADGVLVKM
ncbi:MAG: hypothetical protein ACI9SJ_000070 [Flavobacteriaceae bacterium]|jgi:hypothetical protein|uniref:DUF4920 domain-containing protein n=1 Tax=Candidatus Marifrigoribacter sp. Uisw_064 TaxID=3230970 RepID=UPI003AEEB188